MVLETNSLLKSVEWWIKFYSYITFAVILYGIAAAHIPALIGTPWSSCESCDCKFDCVLIFHLYEVPLVTYNAFFAWYGLKRYSLITINNYSSLLSFSILSSTAFFTFESLLLLNNVQKGAPAWENYALTSVAGILVSGAGLGVYVKQKLVSYLNQENKA
jgi:hypothetical protein